MPRSAMAESGTCQRARKPAKVDARVWLWLFPDSAADPPDSEKARVRRSLHDSPANGSIVVSGVIGTA
ncbi:hypothetical protein D3C72_1757040 [compost metagenome]